MLRKTLANLSKQVHSMGTCTSDHILGSVSPAHLMQDIICPFTERRKESARASKSKELEQAAKSILPASSPFPLPLPAFLQKAVLGRGQAAPDTPDRLYPECRPEQANLTLGRYVQPRFS